MLELSGVPGGGTLRQNSTEQERPYLAAESGKTEHIRPEAESARGQEGVRGVHSSGEGVQDNTPEGRGPALIMLARR